MEPDKTPELPMVCGRSINGDPHYFPNAEYRGRRIYFCTEFCRNAFEASPDRFVEVHSHGMIHELEECPLGLKDVSNNIP